MLAKAIEKCIKVIGISFISLGSEEYSPTQSEDFKNNKIKNAKKENFEYHISQLLNIIPNIKFIYILFLFQIPNLCFVYHPLNFLKKIQRCIFNRYLLYNRLK